MIKIPQVFFWKFYSRGKLTGTKTLFCDIHEGVYLQHPLPWISDTNSTLLQAQFEKSQTKRTTFLWKKSSPTHESPFNFKNWSGKSDEFEKLVGEKWLIFQKWLNISPTFFSPIKYSGGGKSINEKIKSSTAKINPCKKKSSIFNPEIRN